MLELKHFKKRVPEATEADPRVEQERAKEQMSEMLDFYCLSADGRRRLLDLRGQDILSQEDRNEITDMMVQAKEATEAHLDQIGMTIELNKTFLRAIQNGDKKTLQGIVAASERELDAREMLPSTASQYACFELDENGRIAAYYPERDPERAKLHEEIIESFFKDTAQVDEPELLIVGGLPGAGKSTSVAAMKPESNVVIVDPDLIKPRLMGGLNEEDSTHVLAAHEESSWLAKRLFEEAKQRGVTIVYDGTFSNIEKFKRMVDAAPEDGYKVSLVFVHGGAESWRRNTLLRPRAVKPKVFQKGLRGYRTLQELVKHPSLHVLLVTDNSSSDAVEARVMFDSNDHTAEDAERLYERHPELQQFLSLSE